MCDDELGGIAPQHIIKNTMPPPHLLFTIGLCVMVLMTWNDPFTWQERLAELQRAGATRPPPELSIIGRSRSVVELVL